MGKEEKSNTKERGRGGERRDRKKKVNAEKEGGRGEKMKHARVSHTLVEGGCLEGPNVAGT